MTAAERRLAALAALFAPERAPALLARLPEGTATTAVSFAARLAAAPRRERLEVLAAALSVDGAAVRTRALSAARAERPRIASLLLALASGEPLPAAVAPALVRLCRERTGR